MEAIRGFDSQVGEVTVPLNSPHLLPKDFVLTVWTATLAVIAVIWVVSLHSIRTALLHATATLKRILLGVGVLIAAKLVWVLRAGLRR
jgi:hypothetical protein